MAEGGKPIDKVPSYERQNTDEVEDLPLKIPVSDLFTSWFLNRAHHLLSRFAPSTITFSAPYACAELMGAASPPVAIASASTA